MFGFFFQINNSTWLKCTLHTWNGNYYIFMGFFVAFYTWNLKPGSYQQLQSFGWLQCFLTQWWAHYHTISPKAVFGLLKHTLTWRWAMLFDDPRKSVFKGVSAQMAVTTVGILNWKPCFWANEMLKTELITLAKSPIAIFQHL